MRGWSPILGACLLVGCAAELTTETQSLDFPGQGVGKADLFGRKLAGVAAEYPADSSLHSQEDRLVTEMGHRRAVAWEIVKRVLEPVPLLGLAEGSVGADEAELSGGVPQVARYQTWYGVDDFKRMFRRLYEGLGVEGRANREPFSDEAIADAISWNATVLDRSERWPLDRYLKHVQSLGVCPDGMSAEDCAKSIQSNFSGATAGNARITYSPGTLTHLLKNYGPLLDCLNTLDTLTFDQAPLDENLNFTYCLQSEFPGDAVITKAHWVRADFGRKLPAFDTDAATLSKVTGFGMSANWGDGDRMLDPTSDDVFTIKLQNGDTYRLAGLHIATKELRHWIWITLWWSDKPNEDFGADRPASFSQLSPIWSNYKMSVTVAYEEGDSDPTRWYADKPTLAAALQAVSGELTWSSNPYIEHGRGNARTNCIGCHQHGGSQVGPDLNGDGELDPFDLEMVIDNDTLYPANGREQIRTVFPTDYLWATKRVDNISEVIRREVALFDFADQDLPEVRASKILELLGDAPAGNALFEANCTGCHGSDGMGTSQAPSLYERVPGLDDTEMVMTLLTGKPSGMPSWSKFEDQDLAHLRTFLRTTFDAQ